MNCRNCDCTRCREANAPGNAPVSVPFMIMIPTPAACTCPRAGWWSVAPPPPCPMHGVFQPITITTTEANS